MKFSELINGKSEFRIAFIGGSITAGAGASTQYNRYSSKFVRDIGTKYPDVKFTEINAGVGGTPSNLGMYRLKSEVLDKNPDFLFIEFAVNDSKGYGSYYEGIIRAARRYNPSLPIMLLYCCTIREAGTTREAPSATICEEREIARAYSLPDCYMGNDLLDAVSAENDEKKYLNDGVHPTDAGYALYAASMMRDIENADFVTENPVLPVTGKEYSPREIPADDSYGWNISNRTIAGRLPYMYADTPGDSVAFEFEGTACGMYSRIEKDGGMVRAVIDGEKEHIISFWDHYALSFDRDAYATIAENLAPGHHSVTITVLPDLPSDSHGKSEGHVCRIGAFMVG